MVELQPRNAEAYYLRSTIFRSLGNHSKAIDDLNAAVRLEPENSSYIATLKEVQGEAKGRN